MVGLLDLAVTLDSRVVLAVTPALGGGSAVEIALVVILFGCGTLWWCYTSAVWDKLRGK
jgi:hypothetical protein